MAGDWVDLDLSTAVFHEVGGVEQGTYSAGVITGVAFEGLDYFFPGLTLNDIDTYEIEITKSDAYGIYVGVWRDLDETDAAWSTGDAHYIIDTFTDDPAGPYVFTVGPGVESWDDAVSAGYNAINFTHGDASHITGIRYRNMTELGGTTFANRDDALDLDGASPVRWVPAVVATPARFANPDDVVKARAYTSVTLGPGPKDARFNSDLVKSTPRARDRILVGGKDVTYLNGVRTPTPDFTLIDPLLYGSGSMTIPQVNPYFGTRPAWLRKFAEVEVQRVVDDEVVATDYIGFIAEMSIEGSGPDAQWRLTLGGQAAGRLSADGYWPPSPFTRRHDAGFLLVDLLRSHGITAKPENGPDLGVPLKKRGGTDALSIFNEILAVASTNANGPLTCYPNFNGVYRIHEKDLETIDATVYFDGELVTPSLGVSFLEDTDVVYATGRTPDGELVNFIVAPGAVQGDPPAVAPDFPFGPGDTDADTSTGDAVSVAQQQLSATPFLNIANVDLGTYDAATADAVAALQDQAGLLIAPEFVGHMTEATWNALWNIGPLGFSLDQARVIPAAQRGYVPKWNLSANGSKLSRNKNYIPASLRPRVVRGIDVGPGFYRHRIQKFSRAQMPPQNQTNWAGPVTCISGVIEGEHNPGDALTTDRIRDARWLRPGMNVWAPLFDGGTLFHVPEVDVRDDGRVVTPVFDVLGRSSTEAWEAIQARQDSRSNPARQHGGALRSTSVRNDNVNDWSDICGLLGSKVTLEGGKWTGFPIFSGQTGVLQQVRAEVSPATEFAMMVAGKKFKDGRLNRRIPDPIGEPPSTPQRHHITITGHPTGGTFTLDGNSNTTSAIARNASAGTVGAAVRTLGGEFSDATAAGPAGGPYVVTMHGGDDNLNVGTNSLTGGSSPSISVTTTGPSDGSDRPWYEDEAVAKYLRDHKVLYGEGTYLNPCGYGASLKTSDGGATGAPLTGIHHDLGGGDYDATSTGFVLWVYLWVAEDTIVQPGRMLWQQLTAGA